MAQPRKTFRAAALLVLAGQPAQPSRAQDIPTIQPGDSQLDLSVVEPNHTVWNFVQIRNGAETVVGTFEREMSFVNHTRDEPAIFNTWHVQFPNRSALDIYYLDRASLGQIARYQTGSNGMWTVYFSDGRVRGTYTRRDGDPVVFDEAISGPLFNGAMIDVVLATLPLEEGYSARIPIFNPTTQSMSAALNVSITVLVVERETLNLAGRSWNTWVVDMERTGANAQRLWIVREPPYLLRRDVRNAEGVVVSGWRLESVR